MSKLLPGNELHPDDIRDVLARYVHRYTRSHRPAWVRDTNYAVQFDSDDDWLANTKFRVRQDGRLDGRCNQCWSTPTWPDNPELRRPQYIGSLT